jgi:ABC-type glutathione transport system ATPase component
MQQRVQIAKAVANNPPVLFLDEVTTGLDFSVQARVLELIKRIQREYGVSMTVVSHHLAVVRMLSDRTIVMFLSMMNVIGLKEGRSNFRTREKFERLAILIRRFHQGYHLIRHRLHA